ncbi:hypothetical protein H5410_056854 [Solanum commersonii]|uniref:Uncharacterized protein n=1 Tax=Solanum commersonii TaxID=4109 RepID=A0A9J5WNX4_SOLCO|nr:hypothetical protein H5410_056854 [Solanum commersonii]
MMRFSTSRRTRVKPVPERRIVTVTVSTISDETCYKVGDNMMYYSTGNKTTTLININDVPHNVGEGFLHARTLRQTITTTTTITPHRKSQSGINLDLGCLQSQFGDNLNKVLAFVLPKHYKLVTKDSKSKEENHKAAEWKLGDPENGYRGLCIFHPRDYIFSFTIV